MIPIFSPVPQYEALKDSLESTLLDIARSGHYILGPQVQAFETAFAAAVGTPYAIGVNSGTDALLLALRALDIGPGDEVITTNFSYVATSEIIVRAGARPVFVDIEADTLNMDLQAVKRAITDKTRAIIPVHLFGLAVDMTALMALAKQHNLAVVEDCAQATGATWKGQSVGSFGTMGCFSFFPTKNLGAMGDGGAITTSDPALAERLKSLRVHGASPTNRYDHLESGINSRLDTIQAGVLLLKLPHLAEWNQQRQQIAAFYTSQIHNSPLANQLIPPILPTDAGQHVYHQYTVKLKTNDAHQRDTLQATLKELGVMGMIYYPIPLHLQKTHQNLGYQSGDFPVAEQAAKQVISLPIYPGLQPEQQVQVITALSQALAHLPQKITGDSEDGLVDRLNIRNELPV